MWRLCEKLLQSLGFVNVNCLEEEKQYKVIDYSVIVRKPTEKTEFYGMMLVFGLKIDDESPLELWCYRYDYLYTVIIHQGDDRIEAELVINDNWREEEEVAKLKLFHGDFVFIGNRLNAIKVVSQLLNESEAVVEKVLQM